MADDASKEFTVNVQFSGVEQDILGGFKKQVEDVAKAITLINDTMKEQIKALESIQKDIKDFNKGSGGYGGGGIATGTPGGVATHMAGHPQGDSSEVVRAMSDLTRTLSSVSSGPSSLFGARGLTSGYRQWDQENSFELQQFPGARFTPQDTVRQMGAVFGFDRYKTRGGADVTSAEIEDMHRAREANPNPNVWRAKHYIEDAEENLPFWQKPWAQQMSHITGTSNYLGSLGNTPEDGIAPDRLALAMARTRTIYPYFAKGGAFNPGTYGLGMGQMRAHAAAIGSGYGRWDAQFGGDTTFNPFSDSGHQYFGAQMQAQRNSWFGLNPFLSTKQAGEIQGAVAGMGYSHGTAENMRNMMSDVTQHTNIGVGDQAAIIDKSFRWGYANLQQLAAFMKHDIPAAAQAARMNVGQFAQQLVQVGTSVGAAHGVGAFTAMGQVTDMATGMGIDPGTAGQMMSDPGLMFYAASIQSRNTGKPYSLGKLVNSPDAAALSAEAVAERFKLITGIDPNEIGALQEAADRDGPDSDAARKLDHAQTVLASPGVAQYVPGATTILEAKRFTHKGIRNTQIAGRTRQFGTDLEAQREHFKEEYKKFHGGKDGGHSFWNSSLSNLGDKSKAEQFADRETAKWAEKHAGKHGRASLIQQIMQMSHGENSDFLGNVLGHHTVDDMSKGRGGTREVLGGHLSIQKITENLHKEIAKKTKKENEKNSKNTTLTLVAGPGLAGMFKIQGSGNSVVQSGTNSVAPADPTNVMYEGEVG